METFDLNITCRKCNCKKVRIYVTQFYDIKINCSECNNEETMR